MSAPGATKGATPSAALGTVLGHLEPRTDHRWWSRADAVEARGWLTDHGLPSGRDEAWLYTPVDVLAATLAVARPAPLVRARDLDAADIERLAGHHEGPRLVCVNGLPAPELSRLHDLPPGVRVGSSSASPTEAPGAASPDRGAPCPALNPAGAPPPGVIAVDPGVDAGPPIQVVHLSVPGDALALTLPRTEVRAGEGGRVVVVEVFTGIGGEATTDAVTRIDAGPGAEVTLHRVQAETAGVIHVGHCRVEQAAGSAVALTSTVAGGDLSRVAIDVALRGEGARVAIDGLYLPGEGERHDNVVTVEHAVPSCTSVQRFKGVIADRGRGSFSGHVVVAPGADGTDSRQSNRSLLLGRSAQADTRPWLEIFADDVKCSHGATVGRLDDDALFYLRSRGIPLQEARPMLTEAFVAEVVEAVEPVSARPFVAEVVAARLAALTGRHVARSRS